MEVATRVAIVLQVADSPFTHVIVDNFRSIALIIRIQPGSLSGFFSSAKETAKEINRRETVTRKNTVWVDTKDLMLLLKPERTNLVKFLRKEKSIVFSNLANREQVKSMPSAFMLCPCLQIIAHQQT